MQRVPEADVPVWPCAVYHMLDLNIYAYTVLLNGRQSDRLTFSMCHAQAVTTRPVIRLAGDTHDCQTLLASIHVPRKARTLHWMSACFGGVHLHATQTFEIPRSPFFHTFYNIPLVKIASSASAFTYMSQTMKDGADRGRPVQEGVHVPRPASRATQPHLRFRHGESCGR